MKRFRRLTLALTACVMLAAPIGCGSANSTKTRPAIGDTLSATGHTTDDGHSGMVWQTAVDPKDLTDRVKKGLDWLAEHQTETGGWGQGDESQNMGRSAHMKKLRDKGNVADTSMAVLALMRSGSSAREGKYAKNIERGLGFIMNEIEESDKDSLFVTSIKGTRVQGKIGTYVDTFTALMILTEAKGNMPNAEKNKRLEKALSKVLAKIEKNQRADGTWDNRGWAPVLSQSIAAKGLNRARQSGEDVDDDTLRRVQQQAQKGFTGKGFGKGGSAGVQLYADAAGSSSLRDSSNTWKVRERKLKKRLDATKDESEKTEIRSKLKEGDKLQIATQTAEHALVARLEDPNFIRGFGNNGGEEFLSYMLVSEALVVEGGDKWERWDANITKLVNGVQNADGSWTGHHCITGRTFCTATALLVLMSDRTPVPIAAQIKRG